MCYRTKRHVHNHRTVSSIYSSRAQPPIRAMVPSVRFTAVRHLAAPLLQTRLFRCSSSFPPILGMVDEYLFVVWMRESNAANSARSFVCLRPKKGPVPLRGVSPEPVEVLGLVQAEAGRFRQGRTPLFGAAGFWLGTFIRRPPAPALTKRTTYTTYRARISRGLLQMPRRN